jgi:hypothetical protein
MKVRMLISMEAEVYFTSDIYFLKNHPNSNLTDGCSVQLITQPRSCDPPSSYVSYFSSRKRTSRWLPPINHRVIRFRAIGDGSSILSLDVQFKALIRAHINDFKTAYSDPTISSLEVSGKGLYKL